MTYDEALKYIHEVNPLFCKPGLERISRLCSALGNPQNGLKFIHVAGTNGKGSTSSILSHILVKAGYRLGLFTSPYIYRFNERIRINNKDIEDEELIELVEKIRPIADGMDDKPTEFELITAMAFEYFKKQACDVIVLEVGLGGRFDSTNIISNPLLSIITGIALDHTAILGDTIEKIAFEKAGIIKDGAPVLFGGEDEDAYGVIKKIAEERGSRVFKVNRGEIKNALPLLTGGKFDYKQYTGVELSLLGTYQFYNGATVLEAVDILRERGIKIDTDAVYSGIKAAKWRARFEVIHSSPAVIFDGAHNPEGITAAVESIESYFIGRRVAIMSGVLRDKDYRAIAKTVGRVADVVYTITPDNPRALSAEEYAKVLQDVGVAAFATNGISDALTKGMAYADEHNCPLCCLGSLYTYSSVIDELEKTK